MKQEIRIGIKEYRYELENMYMNWGIRKGNKDYGCEWENPDMNWVIYGWIKEYIDEIRNRRGIGEWIKVYVYVLRHKAMN